MASDTLSSYDFAGKAEVQLLPTAAHEVSCVLLYTIESPSGTNENVCLGQIDEDFENLPPVPVLVRLGTKVSDTHTSNIGFRVFLQQDAGKAHSTGHLEDNYRIFSFSFVHVGNAVDIHPASELDRIHLIRGAAPRYYPGSELYCLNFIADGVGKTFLPSQHGDELRSSSVTVQNAVKQLQPLIRVKQASLFFHADPVLLEHLDQAIERNGMGIEAPSWKDSLPESAVPTWPADSQPRMIAGSTDLINDLYTALRLAPLGDGPGTSLEDRPQAKRFAAFVRTMYPSTKEPESAGKVYPIMLNVGNGLCLDLPFGASMYNQENVLTGIKVLLRLVSMGVPVSAIGIVAFYPAQAQAYQKELAQCHRRSPPTGYDKIAVITLEGWVGKEIEIAIVDMVRTRNASGNLGWLSQNRRLKLALTLHRDGLIILGDRKCTANSHGEIISTKLEKVLQWFDVNGRIVNVSREGLPVANEGQLPDVKSEPAITNKGKAYPYTPSSWTQPATARMYLGAPGLEESITHSGLDKNGNAPDYAGAPIGVKEVRKDIISARQSFERQFGPSTMQQLSAYNTATASKKYVGGATTPEDLDAKASHPEVQDSFARQGLVRKGRGAFLYDGPESPEESSQRQQFDGLEHNEGKKEVVMPSVRSTRPHCVSTILEAKIQVLGKERLEQLKSENKAPKADDPPAAVRSARPVYLSTMSKAIVHTMGKGRLEKSSEIFSTVDQIKRGSESKASRAADPSAVVRPTRPAYVSTISEAKIQALGKERVEKLPGGKERLERLPGNPSTFKPDVVSSEAAPTKLRTRLDNISLESTSQIPRVGLSPTKENAAPTSPTNLRSDIKASEIDSHFAASNGKLHLTENGTRGSSSYSTPRPVSGGLSIRNTNIEQPAKKDFKTQYRGKYNAIRDIFANTDRPSGAHGSEDRLFRNLAEALMDEDARAFDCAYHELLGLASGMHDTTVEHYH